MIIKRQKQYSLISRGYRWIKELRNIDPLPLTLEEYEKFIFPFILENGKVKEDPDPRIDKIIDRIELKYGKKSDELLARVGRAYVFGRFSIKINILEEKGSAEYWEAIKFSYNRIQHLPKRYMSDSLGNGSCGIVFDYPGGKIEKINFNPFTLNEYKFYQYLMRTPINVFPRVFDLEKDQVIMEKLLIESPKLEKLRDILDKYRIKYSTKLNKLLFHKDIDWEGLKSEVGENHEFYRFFKDCEKGLYKIFGQRTMGDLCIQNIGQRESTGELVYFDPVGGFLAET